MTEILDEGAVDQIAARTLTGHYPDLDQVPALCATVKHLSAALSKADDIVVEAVRVNGDLQSQLEQLRADKERLRKIVAEALRFRVEVNGSCGHDEPMAKLCTQCEIRAALLSSYRIDPAACNGR